MPRALRLCLALALLLATVPVAHAQLGGLKKKVLDKATGKDTVAAAGKAGAKPKCDASSLVITSDVVSRYLKSLGARDAEMQKLAKEPGKVGAYYTAYLKRREVERRMAVFDLHRGPEWEKYQALSKRLQTGDTAAVKEIAAVEVSINASLVDVPSLDWADQEKMNARIDSTMRVAGGFNECDWLTVGENIPRLVYSMADDPSKVTGAEADAVRPRIGELALAMNIRYVSPADKARLQAEKDKEEADAKAAAEAAKTTGNPMLDCMAKVQGEWTKRHKAEMDKASNSQDVATLMSLSQQMNQEALAKCNKD